MPHAGPFMVLWAPAQSARLDLNSPAVAQFRIHQADGRPAIKSCSVLGWTP